MKTRYSIAATAILLIVLCSKVYSQIDSIDQNWISHIGISHRFSSKSSNELGTDENGIQYNIDVGYEWKISAKQKIGIIISGQIVSQNYDAYLTPMVSWRYISSVDWSHRLAAGPILVKSYNDIDVIDGFSLSYDLEILNSVAVTNRFDLLNDSNIGAIYSYSPGIELRGKYAKVFIITGTAVTCVGAILFISAIRKSN